MPEMDNWSKRFNSYCVRQSLYRRWCLPLGKLWLLFLISTALWFLLHPAMTAMHVCNLCWTDKSLLLLQVSTNGYLSFEEPPEIHHHALFNSILIPLIAPFWSDFDFRISGTVYYRTSQDRVLLSEVIEAVVSSNPDFDGFQPTSCAVVTWSQGSLFSEVSNQIMVCKQNSQITWPLL